MRRRVRPQALAIATCGRCGKRSYGSRREARRAARAIHPADVLRAYRCGAWWHIGHTPQRAKRGEAA